MKKWLNSIKFIVLIILILGFVAYSYLNKKEEGFQQQTDNDFHFPHFDVSANYFTLSQVEQAAGFSQSPDSLILNIGTSFGVDPNNIPWDSENRELNPFEILWGGVSREASASLFHKIFVKQQLIALKIAEDGKFYYDSPILHFGTHDPYIGNIVQAGDFIVNFVAPLALPIASEYIAEAGDRAANRYFSKDVGMTEKDIAEREKKIDKGISEKQKRFAEKQNQFEKKLSAVESQRGKLTSQLNNSKGLDDVIDPATEKRVFTKMKGRQFLRAAKSAIDKNARLTSDTVKDIETKRVLTFKGKALKMCAGIFNVIFNWIDVVFPVEVMPLTNGIMNFIYMSLIMPIIMSLAMPLIAPRKGTVAYIENQVAGVITTLIAMSVTAGLQIRVGYLALTNPAFQPAAVVAGRATMAAAVAGALAAFFQQKDAVPNGYRSVMEGLMEKSGHGSGDGKCPAGYTAMDEVINPTTEIFLSFCPVIGDLFDLIYPYTCVKTDFMTTSQKSGLVCIRDPYIIPAYLEQQWNSALYMDWPDYNSKHGTATNVMSGKRRTGALTYDWSSYTSFDPVLANPNTYCNVDVELDNFKKKITYQYIGGKTSKDTPQPDPTFRGFYLDFTEPSILVEMAQFYYNYAIRKGFPNKDGTVTVQYISRINYVIASSLFTCDAMCEMINVTYNPITGEQLKESQSFDADRRFYFRWRKDPSKPISDTSCAPVTPIWGQDGRNATKTSVWGTENLVTWRALDDAYDEAIYNLNDVLHFPNNPSLDSTGLIGAELLVTAYELYDEVKERSDYMAGYLYSNYISDTTVYSPYNITLSNAYQNLLTSSNAATAITTGQYAGEATFTTNQSNYISNLYVYESILQLVDPFYLDLKINTETAMSNYLNVLGRLYTNNENSNIYHKNDIDFNSNPIINDLESRIINVITARNNLWNQHKTDRPSLFNYDFQQNIPATTGTPKEFAYMSTKYFDVTGCTFLDGAALTVISPDVRNYQEDLRFPVQFDVVPYLKRCALINITTDKCIDLSNVEVVIQSFKNQNPDKRIKTIHNIQAKGNNMCQFIWDQYPVTDPANVVRTSNRILYQQDLSGCTFCLPKDATTKSNVIYVDTIGETGTNIGLPPSDDSVRYYTQPTNPLGLGIASGFTDNTTPNQDRPLGFTKAAYLKPSADFTLGIPNSFSYITNVDTTVPRYNSGTYKQLPDLIRPKKPIRINYPNEVESKLGNELSNYCSDPVNMSNFILKYNQNLANTDKILNIRRAFTTSPTRCAFEVDMLLQSPTKPDGTPYLSYSINNIVSIDETTTTILLDSVPNGYYSNSILNIGFTAGSRAIKYKLLNNNQIGENFSLYNQNGSDKAIFQSIQGLRKIREIDMSNKKITYENDMKRFPENVDPTTIQGNLLGSLGSIIDLNGFPSIFTESLTSFGNPGTTSLVFTVARKSIAADMTSLGNMTEPFINTPFTYQSLKTGIDGEGLDIRKNTSTLNTTYSNTGFGFSKPIKENTNKKFGSNTTQFNDKIVTDYINSVKSLKDTTSDFLRNIYNNIHLSNNGVDTGRTCSDPMIMQRIMDSYNNISTPTGLFNQETHTMKQIIQASTDESNHCHITFENKSEQYYDYYSYNRTDSNNYTQTNTLMFKRFPMVYDSALNSFKPNETSSNFNSTLQASDLALTFGSNFTSYVKSARTPAICQLPQISDFTVISNAYYTMNGNKHTITSNIKSSNIGYNRRDYLINQRMTKKDGTIINLKNILRVKFNLAPYNGSEECIFTPDTTSMIVQMVLRDTATSNSLNYPYVQFIDVGQTSLTGSDNISPLFTDPEYSRSS